MGLRRQGPPNSTECPSKPPRHGRWVGNMTSHQPISEDQGAHNMVWPILSPSLSAFPTLWLSQQYRGKEGGRPEVKPKAPNLKIRRWNGRGKYWWGYSSLSTCGRQLKHRGKSTRWGHKNSKLNSSLGSLYTLLPEIFRAQLLHP